MAKLTGSTRPCPPSIIYLVVTLVALAKTVGVAGVETEYSHFLPILVPVNLHAPVVTLLLLVLGQKQVRQLFDLLACDEALLHHLQIRHKGTFYDPFPLGLLVAEHGFVVAEFVVVLHPALQIPEYGLGIDASPRLAADAFDVLHALCGSSTSHEDGSKDELKVHLAGCESAVEAFTGLLLAMPRHTFADFALRGSPQGV